MSTEHPPYRPLPQPLDAAPVDRAAHRRTEDGLVGRLVTEPATRVLLVHRGRLATAVDGSLALLPGSAVDGAPTTGGSERPRWLFLGEGCPARDAAGEGEGSPDVPTSYLALVLPDDADAEEVDIEGVDPAEALAVLARTHTWSGLRELSTRLDATQAALATEAVALAAWHAAHERCPRCGEPTTLENAGWTRRCVAQGIELYPRTDPAVIMAVVHGGDTGPDDEPADTAGRDGGERLLLGHAAHWPERRFSTLAGYVEPGESLENAVRREVREEAGVEIGEVTYRGSQPWPHPASLMLGFFASATTTALQVDGVELTDARWFTRAELERDVRSGEVLLPGRASIARALIEDWFGAELPGA
ncbi:NUDIX domain-containing protein [Cellulosimicrobium sp. PMB13]|uniref:NAD(+) diphosphatase n=1 Tax=Cellulosimicrobium sp. PMB13 TaxID=3120158 RepID=UPI003F4C3205